MTDRQWPFYPLAWLHDSARCLALVRQGRLALNTRGRLQISSLALLTRMFLLQPPTPSPRSESQAPNLSLLIGLVQKAGLVVAKEGRLRLTSGVDDWLDLPAAQQLARLRHVWWFEPALNWRWFRRTRRQHSLDGRWRTLVAETARWVAGLSPFEWTHAGELEHYLTDRGLLEPVGAGRNLPSVRQAVRRRTQNLIRFLLCSAMRDLGLIELGDLVEKRHLRPTPEGAAWLRAALAQSQRLNQPPPGTGVEETIPHDELYFPPSNLAPLTVRLDPAAQAKPSLAVTLQLVAPTAWTFEIAHFAHLRSPGPPARYQVTRATLERAIGWGYTPSDVLFALHRFSDGPLSSDVEAQLDRWRGKIARVTCESGYRLRFSSAAVSQALRRRKPFRRRIRPLASSREIWVGREEAAGLWRYLRRLGYTLVPSEEARLESLPRYPLPLLPLLVALRTYQVLNDRCPGLADLDLASLIRTLERSLSSDDRSAAERLIASHTALLDQALAPTTSIKTSEDFDAPKTEGLLDRLKMAIQSDMILEIRYADNQGQVTRRRVRPLHLQKRWGHTYLVAFCELRQDERHFRLDRIVAVRAASH